MDATNFTVYDGAATPVARVLKPVGNETREEGTLFTHKWQAFDPSLPDAGQMSVIHSRKRLKSGTQVLGVMVELPFMETITATSPTGYEVPPRVAFTERCSVTRIKSKRSTELTGRVALMALLNHCSDRQTTAAAITDGVVADTLQRGIIPT